MWCKNHIFAPQEYNNMATVTAFIRVSRKSTKARLANVRFRLRSGRNFQFFYSSELRVLPDNWDSKKQCLKAQKRLIVEADRIDFDNRVAELKLLISNLYNANPGISEDSLKLEIDKRLHPGRYASTDNNFFPAFDYFIQNHKSSPLRLRHFKVVYRDLQRFEAYLRINKSKNFVITFESLTPDLLREFEKFLSIEHKFFTTNKKGKIVCKPEYKIIYEVSPERRPPQPRGQNTINGMLTKLRTFYIWANSTGRTKNNPFAHYTIHQSEYGDPYFIDIEERRMLQHFDFGVDKRLATQRDIFVFQCLVGCRVGDLYRFTKNNIIDGELVYIPHKTEDNNAKSVHVPLTASAIEILDKYEDYKGAELFPFISEQKYNKAIKEIFTKAGLTRKVIVRNSTTGENESRPLNEIASSHIARRTFAGNLYNNIKDPNIISKLTGHVEGSKAFARYRAISKEVRIEAVNSLE